ncbi:MAG: four helix bundle protein [Parcubacteria group bacterium]|nr:four helix bundle protein [Parcubacteria group bacterium]
MHSYKDLIVWQKAIKLVFEIYSVTEYFPKEEIYGLTSQMRRAAVSIPSNIAEGRVRGSRKEYRQFLLTAYGSGAELETQVILSKQLPKTKELNYIVVDALLDEVMKMLNAMINKLYIRPVA